MRAETMRRLLALGCDMDTLVLAARFEEHPKGGVEMFEAILSGFEGRTVGDTFNDFFNRFVEALGGLPEPRVPANDQSCRMNTYQRRVAYERLAERDGEWCSECSAEPVTIWRRMGVFGAAGDGQYTKVHPTSNLEVDHKEPLWAGGTNDLGNLWLLCIDCHKRKTALEASHRRRA